MTPKLSVIIVNCHSSDALEHCLRSLHVATQDSLEIILVDNSPEDGAEKILTASGWHGHYFPQPKNVGYTPGANFGAAHARGETLCFVHPDVLFEGHSLERLAAWVEQHPRSVAGPRQKSRAGNILTSAWPLMTRRTIWGPAEHQGSPWPRSWHSAMAWLHPSLALSDDLQAANAPNHVPALNSSCLVMPRAVWEDVGGFNEELQLVGLESEWFERAQELGILAWYIPDAVVYHEQSVSLRRVETWRIKEITDHDRRWYARRFGLAAVGILVVIIWLEHIFRPKEAR